MTKQIIDAIDRQRIIEQHREVLALINDGHDRQCAVGVVFRGDGCICTGARHTEEGDG